MTKMIEKRDNKQSTLVAPRTMVQWRIMHLFARYLGQLAPTIIVFCKIKILKGRVTQTFAKAATDKQCKNNWLFRYTGDYTT